MQTKANKHKSNKEKIMKEMTQETKTKLHDVHVELAKDPARRSFLQSIARDPVNKEKRAAAIRAKWADPVWKAATLAKMKAAREAKKAEEAQAEADRTTPAEKAAAEANEAKAPAPVDVVPGDNPNTPSEEELTGVAPVETPAPAKKKRVVTDAQKAKYAANRKAKRAKMPGYTEAAQAAEGQ